MLASCRVTGFDLSLRSLQGWGLSPVQLMKLRLQRMCQVPFLVRVVLPSCRSHRLSVRLEKSAMWCGKAELLYYTMEQLTVCLIGQPGR